MTDAFPPAPQGVPSGPAPKSSLKWWLIASATLNLLLLGLIGGGAIAMKRHGGPFGGMRPPAEDFGLIAFARTLPEERRQEIKKDLRQARSRIKPHMEAISAARAKAADLLAADPLDQAALTTALEAVQGEEVKLKAEGRSIFIEEASKLSLEERRALAELWKKRRGRGPKHEEDEKK